MAYIIVNGTKRKECENLRQALEYMTEGSIIYKEDGFGNLLPMSKEDIKGGAANVSAEAQKATPPAPAAEPVQPAQPNRSSELAKKLLAEPEKKESPLGNILKTIIFLLMGILLLFIVFMIIRPLTTDFYKAFMNF